MAKNALKAVVSVSDTAALLFINLCAVFVFRLCVWHLFFFVHRLFVVVSFCRLSFCTLCVVISFLLCFSFSFSFSFVRWLFLVFLFVIYI